MNLRKQNLKNQIEEATNSALKKKWNKEKEQQEKVKRLQYERTFS